jgi:hypothetical protein
MSEQIVVVDGEECVFNHGDLANPNFTTFAEEIANWKPKRVYDVRGGDGVIGGMGYRVRHQMSDEIFTGVIRVEFRDDCDTGLARVTFYVRFEGKFLCDELTREAIQQTAFLRVSVRPKPVTEGEVS